MASVPAFNGGYLNWPWAMSLPRRWSRCFRPQLLCRSQSPAPLTAAGNRYPRIEAIRLDPQRDLVEGDILTIAIWGGIWRDRPV
jgi:hypothetical protein